MRRCLCILLVCCATSVAHAQEPVDEAPTVIDGSRFFLGGTVLGGWALSSSADRFLLIAAPRVGAYFGQHELALEIAPFTQVYGFEGVTFQVNVSYAYLIAITRGTDAALYWPVRFGAGFLAEGIFGVEGRVDVLGLALQLGQVMLDFHLPSYRFAIFFDDGLGGSDFRLHWGAGLSVSYFF